MTERITNLCRPFGNKGQLFCISCCRPGCPLLSQGDKTKLGGCLGQNGQVFDGIKKTELCESFQCWNTQVLANLPNQEIAALKNELSCLPQGQYNPTHILKEYNLSGAA